MHSKNKRSNKYKNITDKKLINTRVLHLWLGTSFFRSLSYVCVSSLCYIFVWITFILPLVMTWSSWRCGGQTRPPQKNKKKQKQKLKNPASISRQWCAYILYVLPQLAFSPFHIQVFNRGRNNTCPHIYLNTLNAHTHASP